MKVVELQLPAGVAKPYFCNNSNDYVKMLYAQIEVIKDSICYGNVDFEDSEEVFSFLHTNIVTICHEYLALVLRGEFEPYEMPEDWVDTNRRSFTTLMHDVNKELSSLGVPMKEGENGQMNIDLKELLEQVKDEA